MKGILAKDAVLLKKHWLYLAIIPAMTYFSDVGALVALFLSVMLPISVLGYDERSRFDRLLVMLPLKSCERVLDKYLLAWLHIALTVVCYAAVKAVMMAMNGAYTPPSEMMVMGLGITLLAQSVALPLIFYFGIEKGRLIYLAAMVVQAAAVGAPMSSHAQVSWQVAGSMLAAGLTLNLISIFVSGRVYEKRLMA